MQPPTRTTLRALLCAGIVLHLIAHPGSLWAKGRSNRANTSEATPAKKKGVSKVTYQRSASEETPAQRDKRMYRECKGLHNAGACRGYTRK